MPIRKAPRLTRVHFRLIADIISGLPSTEENKRLVSVAFANSLGAYNSAFDRNKFIAACNKIAGIEP